MPKIEVQSLNIWSSHPYKFSHSEWNSNRILQESEKFSSEETAVYHKVCRGYFVFGFIKIQTVVISSLSLFVLTSVYTDIVICPSFTFEIMHLRLTVS